MKKVMIVSMSLTIVILWYVKKKKTKEFGWRCKYNSYHINFVIYNSIYKN